MGVLRSMRLGKGARLAQAAAGLAAAGGLNSKPDSWGKILAYKCVLSQPLLLLLLASEVTCFRSAERLSLCADSTNL
jgi:hypothetical protein